MLDQIRVDYKGEGKQLDEMGERRTKNKMVRLGGIGE